ncbi:MAG: 23S rRNA (uracil(1939)-C(5))-methyltransferase RlmD [Alphaproteobacteria bacterium]|nr:23S rRNA (uracil(1939)-C(5))-methyltransferase RlmD [Alphaproteobacteria bacterium]
MGDISESVELHITHLATQGDGVAMHDGQPVYVPYALPDELVRVTQPHAGRAELLEVITPSAQRIPPPCIHFTVCGGCELQHLSEEAYVAFKRGIALQVAKRLGVDERIVAPLMRVPAQSRRRAEFKVSVAKGEIAIGFMAARSHALVDVQECPVVEPIIAASLPAWRDVLASLKSPSNIKSIHMTVVEGGLSILLQIAGKFKPNDREKLAAFAKEQGFIRLAEQVGEAREQTVIHRAGEAQVRFADVAVDLAAGAFLQATKPSEAELVAQVLAGCAGHARVIDLYSGCGTFTFPLTKARHSVDAYEGSSDMTNAGFNAARREGLEQTARFTARDLFKSPLKSAELTRYDAAVINPPRNGALPQVKELSEAGIARIVMVSCNPATFERDAKHLLESGYRLDSLVPVDQFLWSHHLEVVGIFSKNS